MADVLEPMTIPPTAVVGVVHPTVPADGERTPVEGPLDLEIIHTRGTPDLQRTGKSQILLRGCVGESAEVGRAAIRADLSGRRARL